MDFLAILRGLKGKALDAANFEILERSYVLQNENLDQLRISNAALTESASLLRDQAERLKVEVRQLQSENERLRQLIPPDSIYEPTPIAVEILRTSNKTDSRVSSRSRRIRA